jgi:GNAT superfamily N-acetyltransferase
MKWPTIDETVQLVPLPNGYRFAQLDRANIAPLIAAIKVWHPNIEVGIASCYLREDFYHSRVCIEGEDEKDIYVYSIWFNNELVGMWSVEREVEALALYARLIVVAPAHRGAKVSGMLTVAYENVGRAMGAEFLYAMVTLNIVQQQRALESAGFRLLGFLPGYDRQLVAPGVVKRIYLAVYAKLLAPEEKVQRPDPKNLTPRAKRVFELLFSN